MTIGCGIKNQTELFRADLLLRCFILHHMAYYNRFLRKRKPEQNFQDRSIFSGKIVPGGTIFPEKIGPGPKFSVEQISMTKQDRL